MSGYIEDMRKIVGHKTLIQCAGSVILVNEEGKILLGRRTDNHLWGYAGGAVEINETVEECARRELYEEMGLTAEELTFFCINSGPEAYYIYPNGDEVSNVEIVYLCRKYHGSLTPQKEEIEELRFFSPEELSITMISPPIIPVIVQYLSLYGPDTKKEQFLSRLSFTEAALNHEVLTELIQMSEDWEAENSCHGYRKNEKTDIEGNRIFLAKNGQETIGYLFGHMETSERDTSFMKAGTKYFEVEELYIKPGHRSQGIGGHLFAYAEDIVRTDTDWIMLSTATKNYKAILHFYVDELGMDFWNARLFKKLNK